MTDRDDDDTADEQQRSELGEVLDSLKRPGDDADDTVVNGGQTRMSWRSVTEETPAEPAPETPAPERSSFQFDLGSALQRLGSPDQPGAPAPQTPPEAAAPAPPLPTRRPANSPESTPEAPQQSAPPSAQEPATAPEAAPLPTREPAARQEAAPEPAPAPAPLPTRQPAARQEPAPAPDPLPTRRPAAAASTPTPAPAPAPAPEPDPRADLEAQRRAVEAAMLDEAARQVPSDAVRAAQAGGAASVFDDARPAPTLPAGTPSGVAGSSASPAAPVIPDVGSLPTLPAAVAAPPPVVEPLATATAATDINAVRSVQMRAKRDERRGKVFGRTFLALVVLAAAVGGALVFGRSVLFPTQWDAGLTAAVDAVQERRGAEFPSTVPLRVMPDGEYAGLALEAWFGADWATQYSEWRALGLATGDAESEAVVQAVVAWRPAFYDPLTDAVYRAASATDEAAAPALRLALEEVFERQAGATPPVIDEPTVGVLAAQSETGRNARAIDRRLLVGSAPTFTLDGAGAPLPLLVEMGVVDTFGDELVAVASAAGERAVFGSPYPESALTATSVDARRAVGSILPPDVEAAGDPVAWGPDSWSLVLGNRLPDATAERLVSLIAADSYRPVTRAGTRCFVAQFQASSSAAATELLGGMTRWAVGAPEAATATATQLTSSTVELFACDPGASVEQPLDRAAVDAALARIAVVPAG